MFKWICLKFLRKITFSNIVFLSIKSLTFLADGKYCGMRKFKDITLGDGYYSSVMVNSTMGCQYHCQMEGKKCDYVEIKQGEVGILCLLYHGKDIIIEEQEDATVLQKICPIGMVMFFTVHVQQLIFSSPEPSGSQGELIVYPCSSVRPSSVRPSVVHHFQRSSSLKQLGQSKPNFT